MDIDTIQIILQVVGRASLQESFPAVPGSPPKSSRYWPVEQGIHMYGSQIPNARIASSRCANEEHWRIESNLASCSGEVAHLARAQQCPHAADEPWYNGTAPNLELGHMEHVMMK